MRVDDGGRPSTVEGFALGPAVADMYTDLRVDPLLRRLLAHSRSLLGTVAGSISFVDTVRGRYDKVAEDGAACRLGQSFPLDEGATGVAVTRRAPVVIDDYGALRGGHLSPGHPAGRGSAAAVPLWWRGEVIGVNVAFAGRHRRFTTTEIDALELLTQSVASAAVKAGAAVPAPPGLLREREPAAFAVSGGWDALGHAGLPHCPARLTRRETEVLRLLADGLSDREIAARLGISAKTVEKHVGAVLRKTGTASRTAAAVHALGRGWLADVPGGDASALR
jgi:DNA-binding CsgD family transcriptional regulator